MKQVLCLFFLFLLCFSLAEVQAQTYANVPGAENVLVVFNELDSTSVQVKNYYQQSRGIPAGNVVPLYLPDTVITINNDTRRINIVEGGNIIRDSLGHEWESWFVTQHAWKYFYEYMAAPIKTHLTNNNLSEIRYIVLCKGIPLKIQAGGDHGSVICNIAVDGLLCMLNTDNYDVLLNSIYNSYRQHANPDPNYNYWALPQIANPYYDDDTAFDMNYRFAPNHYGIAWNGHTIKLDYLVSHLDGISFDMVKSMIDRSDSAIHASDYDWFIDGDPVPCFGGGIMTSFANTTASKLNSLGLTNYSFDVTEDTNTYHTKQIMSYSSNGVHTTLGPYYYPNCHDYAFQPDYIQSTLDFNYAHGAIFNTAESHNAYLFNSISRRPGALQGQIVEFFLKGGTVGVAHAYEPFTTYMINDGIMFPLYQIGYSFIDAAYMGMPYLGWQNVFVGDPLTSIAWGKQTIQDSISFEGTNLIAGEITIESNIYITESAVLNFIYEGNKG